MKLYYAAGACSVAPMIALAEAEIRHELEPVDFMRGRLLRDGRKLSDVNDRDYVPALILDDGQLLTEIAAILPYLADLRPEAKLAPPQGTFERVRFQEWLGFIATELHKGLGPLFAKESGDEYKNVAIEKLRRRFGSLAKGLGDKPFLFGDFTFADAYAYYAMRAWTRMFKQELPQMLFAYADRIRSRPKVKAALEAEGFER